MNKSDCELKLLFIRRFTSGHIQYNAAVFRSALNELAELSQIKFRKPLV